MKVCESHAGASDDVIVNLDTIHAKHAGHCYEVSGTNKHVDAVRKWLKDHHTPSHDGPCAEKSDNCW